MAWVRRFGIIYVISLVTPGLNEYDSSDRNALINFNGNGQLWGQPQYSSYVLHILTQMKQQKLLK